MKKVAMLLIAMIAMAVGFEASAQESAKAKAMALGLDLGYVSKNESMVIGGFFQYQLAGNFRVAPSLTGYVRNKHADAFVADVNLHYTMGIANEPIGLYPLVGIDFASWSHHFGDMSLNKTRVGANVGAGFEYFFKSDMKFNVELKYVLTKDYSTFVSTVGLAFLF